MTANPSGKPFPRRGLAVCLFALLLSVNAPAAQVMVFAAASLTDSLKEIAADYQKSSGDEIVFNFAASGVLARQIEAGAPADIFLSADESQMDNVATNGLIVPETRQVLLGNSLVIVTPQDNTTIHAPSDLTNAVVHRLALGETKTVPAGTYAQSYLAKAGLWSAVEPKVVACENVRAVLAVVESGNAEAGIVYKTDAAISKHVRVAYEMNAAGAPKIVYPLALLKSAPQPDAAKKFIAYLTSENAAKVFQQFGFTVPSAARASQPLHTQQPVQHPVRQLQFSLIR